MNLLVSLRELLETHPHTGRMMDGAHTLCFLRQEDHCYKFWSPNASEPTNNGLSLQTFLWSALGKQWFLQYSPPVESHLPVQDHGVKRRDEPFPGLRSGVLSCPLFTAVCNFHRSYMNWIWIKYTSTFPWHPPPPLCWCHERLKIACDMSCIYPWHIFARDRGKKVKMWSIVYKPVETSSTMLTYCRTSLLLKPEVRVLLPQCLPILLFHKYTLCWEIRMLYLLVSREPALFTALAISNRVLWRKTLLYLPLFLACVFEGRALTTIFSSKWSWKTVSSADTYWHMKMNIVLCTLLHRPILQIYHRLRFKKADLVL